MAFKAGSIFADAEIRTKKWTGGLNKMTKGVVIAGAAITAAFVAIMTKSIKAADGFQKSMSNVSTLIDTTVISTQDLTLQLLRLSPELGKTTELTDALYQAFSAGAEDAEEAMQITTDAAKFGKAALTDTFTAVDVLTTAVNAYGKETMDTTRASDIFFTTIKRGKITGDQLATSIGTSIPLFASAGISLEELSSGMAAMTKQGVSANVATTQLNSIVTAFLKPSESMAGAIQRMGFESGAAFLKAEGLAGALKLVEEETQGDAAAMSELLPNIRALRGAMALTGVGGEEFNATLKAMSTNTGVTDEAFKKQEKTFATFGASMDTLSIVVGNVGKAFVDDVVVGLTDSAVAVKEFLLSTEGMHLFAEIASRLDGGFELIKIIGETLFDAFKPVVKEIWEPLTEIFTELFGEVSDGSGVFKIFSIAINIVTTTIAVIGKVIKTRITLIRDFIIAVKAAVTPIANFGKVLKGEMSLKEFKDGFAQVGDAFKNLGTNYVQGVGDIFKTIKDEISTFSQDTETLTATIIANVNTVVKETNESVRANYNNLVTGQEDASTDIVETVDKMSDELEKRYEEAGEVIKDEVRAVVEFFDSEWGDELEDWDEQLGARYVKTFFLKTAEVEEEVVRSTGTLKTSWEQAFDSNTLKFKQFADAVPLHNTIIEEDTKETIWNMQTTWKDYFSSISSGFQTVMSGILSVFNTVFGNQTDTITNETNAQLDILQDSYDTDLSNLQTKFDDELITQEEFDDAKLILDSKHKTDKAQLEDDALIKTNAILKKQFETQKAFNIAQVWMDAASAIMGWWKAATSLGPIAGPIFGVVMTAATTGVAIAQTVAIAGQQFIPSKEAGGRASGTTRINESGGEIVKLPDNSLVIPNDISQQIANKAGGNTMINVSFDGARISDDVSLERITDRVIKKLGKEMRLAG